MNVKELHEICKKAIEDGKGDSAVVFDSCAVCFDVHLIDVSSAYIESEPEEYLILNFRMQKDIYHDNIT